VRFVFIQFTFVLEKSYFKNYLLWVWIHPRLQNHYYLVLFTYIPTNSLWPHIFSHWQTDLGQAKGQSLKKRSLVLPAITTMCTYNVLGGGGRGLTLASYKPTPSLPSSNLLREKTGVGGQIPIPGLSLTIQGTQPP
jgi:hypothetical protein